MNGASHELLAGPGLAGNQHGRVGRRDARYALEHVAQPGGSADDPARCRGRGDLLAQGDVLVLELAPEPLDLLESERVRHRRSDRAGHVLEDLHLFGSERQKLHARNQQGADELVAHDQRQHHHALGTRSPDPGPVQPRVALDVVDHQRLALPLQDVLHHGRVLVGVLPLCASRFRDPMDIDGVALAGKPRIAPEAEPAHPHTCRFVGEHADEIDRDDLIQRARRGFQHARQLALRVRGLGHGQERLVLRLARPAGVHVWVLR